METQNVQHRQRILVVDDEKGVREMIQSFLTTEGYLVTTAEDGIDALGKLQDDSYDLLITDLVMPNMDGLELIDCVCRRSPKITSLIITGSPIESIPKYVEQRGVFACISKPFPLNHLSQMVRKGLDRTRPC